MRPIGARAQNYTILERDAARCRPDYVFLISCIDLCSRYAYAKDITKSNNRKLSRDIDIFTFILTLTDALPKT